MSERISSLPASGTTAREEWALNWPLVASAMIGLSFGTVPSATLGLFMTPLQNEFGWSRSEISAGLTVFALVSLPLTPVVGIMVDRFGARRIAVPGLILSSLAFGSFGLVDGSLGYWFALWVAFTLASLMIRTLVFNTAVSGAFHASRGLAIALVLCGTAFAQALAPIVSRWLIDSAGWRSAYFGLAVGWGGTAFLLTFVGFRVRSRPRDIEGDVLASAPIAGGLTLGEAFRSKAVRRIAAATFLQTTMIVGVMVHLVPMLTERGLSRVEAASVAALLGLASISGNLMTGWLADRVSGSWLPTLSFAGPAVAYLLLWRGANSVLVMSVAVLLLGYCASASLQLTTYLTTRYAGMRSFGTIFGLVSTLIAFAAGVGPLLAGAIFDAEGSYVPLLIAGCLAGVLTSALMFRLGTYPEFGSEEQERAIESCQA